MKLPKLPQLLTRKIYKTGQTRGADDDVIYQNRVGRNSTVLIPYSIIDKFIKFPIEEGFFEKNYTVLISSQDYFKNKKIESKLKKVKLALGRNCLVFYETRQDWNKYNPKKLGWKPAQKRNAPLGGNYVARVPATTATDGGEKIILGYNTTSGKGAGIRLYEYASSEVIKKCRLQLEAIFWHCIDAESSVCEYGMDIDDAKTRKNHILKEAQTEKVLNYKKLRESRVINENNETTCPLCLEKLSGLGFFSRMIQPEGREVPDLTVTEINLFHIEELKFGHYNHKPYNLGWGHHHCNVVTKDSGINETLIWMKQVLQKNKDSGFIT